MLKFCRPTGQASFLQVVMTLCFALGFVVMAQAQSSNNILGLPAVPQQAQPPQAPGSSPIVSRPGNAAVQPTDADVKSAISGNIKLASFYQEGLVTVRLVTDKTYVGSGPRAQALQAARLVQRDVRLSCSRLCKSGPMPAPTLLADNTLSFDLVLSGYAGTLTTTDMINLASAKAISPGAKAVVAPAASAVSRAVRSGASSPAALAALASPVISAVPAAAASPTSAPVAP